MTAIRIERKTIIDFSNQKLNRHRVTQALKKATPLVSDEGTVPWLCCDNDIIIGMYIVRLWTTTPMKNLTARKWKTFGFSIYEKTTNGERILDLSKHYLFKSQYWSSCDILNAGGEFLSHGMTTKDLVNIIMHCNRLNSLRPFL